MSAKHELRLFLEDQVATRVHSGESIDQNQDCYSQALFVQQRLLEFPFEQYPDYVYPGYLITHPHIRWEHVEQTIRFCEMMRQPKGARAGQPVYVLGFQALILYCILGPEDPATNLRIVRTAVMTIARKNGKSALVAMMFLAMMSLQVFDLKAQDIQVGASDREQAGILYDLIEKLVLLDDALGLPDIYHLVPSKKTIVQKQTYSKLHCLSSDAYRAHGANPVAVLLDEFGNMPDSRAREFYGVLSTAFGSQLEPLLMMFSTQAPMDSHIFSEFVDQAKVANVAGVDEDGVVGFIFDLPKEDDGTGLVLKEDGKTVDHFAEANWARPNPGLEGISDHGFRSLSDLRIKINQARKMPSLSNQVRNLQLNQRITSHSPFISQQAWTACLVDPINEEALEVAECFGAGDLSVTSDLSALAFVWRLEDGRYYARLLPYTPEENLYDRSREAKVPYDIWVGDGYLNALPGKTIEYGYIAADIVKVAEKYLLEKMGFDRYKWDQIRKECLAIDFEPYENEEGDFWVPIGQGFLGAEPCVTALEKLIITGRLMIETNPVATWCAANCVTVADASMNRKFEKAKSYGKIDCVVALAMACYLATEGDLDERSGENESAYDKEGAGLLVL